VLTGAMNVAPAFMTPVIVAESVWTSTMSHTRKYPDRQLVFLQELTNADVANDVVEIANGIWAIHGDIPIDRDVIMAAFDTYDQARIVLDQFLNWSARNAIP
jgi:hypothetical protein